MACAEKASCDLNFMGYHEELEKMVAGVPVGGCHEFVAGTLFVFADCVWYLWVDPQPKKLGWEFRTKEGLVHWFRGMDPEKAGGRRITAP